MKYGLKGSIRVRTDYSSQASFFSFTTCIVPIKCSLLYVCVATMLVEDHGHKTQTKTKGNQYQWWRPFTVSLFQIHDLPPPHAVVAPRLKLIVTHICSLSANHTVLQAIILPAMVGPQMSHNDPLPTSCIIWCRCSWQSLPLTMNYSVLMCELVVHWSTSVFTDVCREDSFLCGLNEKVNDASVVSNMAGFVDRFLAQKDQLSMCWLHFLYTDEQRYMPWKNVSVNLLLWWYTISLEACISYCSSHKEL